MIEMKNKVKITMEFDVKDECVSKIYEQLNEINTPICKVDKLIELASNISKSSNKTVTNIQHSLLDRYLNFTFNLNGAVHNITCNLNDIINDLENNVANLQQLYDYLFKQAETVEIRKSKWVLCNKLVRVDTIDKRTMGVDKSSSGFPILAFRKMVSLDIIDKLTSFMVGDGNVDNDKK